ncbi:family 43 glycosylhydrolase [Bifidobacterium imperatoris]|uniref:Family 43 glycosylhydrolase n=1 Tax=Bifidobacterium imperatoris TaxID=2020965 RepID=A0A2N5ITG6_9BIFI|nr:glycoside hydrolase family 43 protein [Bifidobacterium imperatoris]PLS25227.1 xylosidase [Bifidobacterium imperatoris]QSY58176.1 family 43 glycosylhydrolase [Bifidobacterium imperatoris]
MTLFNVKPARRIASGFHPDPTICETPQGTYLMVNSSFEFFPGLPVFESEDGEHWHKIGDAMNRPEQFPYETMDNSQGIYAPTLRYHDGIYYLIVTNVNTGNMILTSTDPHAGWSDPIWVEGWPGIDPSLFFDDDGTAYICGNEGGEPDENGEREPAGIYLSKIDVTTGTVLTKRKRICGGITGSNPEGPHMYKRGDTYYLMWAEGGTESGHMENIARSNNPTGPYEMYPGNPLITNRSTHLTLQAIGHCDCAHFEDDRTLMVFHGTRNNNEYPAQGWVGREPYAVWFDWKDGWPELADQSYDCDLNGHNDSLESDVEWITPGIDSDKQYIVSSGHAMAPATTNNATITVHAAAQSFDLTHGAPMIGTRQTDLRFEFGATLADARALSLGEAGVAVYANSHHYLTIAVRASDANGLIRVKATAHNAGLATIVGTVAVPASAKLRLIVRGDESGYDFAVANTSAFAGGEQLLGHVPGKLLSFTNAGGFTGILLGVYAHGQGNITFNNVHYSVQQ